MIDNAAILSFILKLIPLHSYQLSIISYQLFGWEAAEGDGHDPRAIYEAVRSRTGQKPFVFLGHTTKGKGVSYMENVPIWHYRSPNREEYEIAMRELDQAAAK